MKRESAPGQETAGILQELRNQWLLGYRSVLMLNEALSDNFVLFITM